MTQQPGEQPPTYAPGTVPAGHPPAFPPPAAVLPPPPAAAPPPGAAPPPAAAPPPGAVPPPGMAPPPGVASPGVVPPGVVPPPPADGRWKPTRVDPLPGTEFGLVQLEVAPAASGPATASLMAGIASIGVSVLVLCFGVAGARDGWGGWVAGAFTLLAVLAGAGAIAAGVVARRQIRRSAEPGRLRFTGGGTAVAGISCGTAGAGIALLALVLGLMLQV